MTDTLWDKWRKHYRNGGLSYAIYRGFKYLAWRIRMIRLSGSKAK